MAVGALACILVVCSVVFHFGVDSIEFPERNELDVGNDPVKSAVKKIRTQYGDVYDCVGFYKQPAFDHPLLKNHTFHPQMGPTSSPRRERTHTFSMENQIDQNKIKLKDGGCPEGTVPIRRMSVDELNQVKQLSQRFSGARINNTLPQRPGSIFAVAQTKSTIKQIYNGVGATISVYNPHVETNQFSSAELVLSNGADMIIVGWTVNPGVYKDNLTRFFIYSVGRDKYCFNSECGFIQVSKEVPLDFPMSPISKRLKHIYMFNYMIHKDTSDNWWLEVGNPSVKLGFWPSQFFSGLSQWGSHVACGGEAYSPPGQPIGSLEIGNGYTIDIKDLQHDAYCRDFIFVDKVFEVLPVAGTEPYGTDGHYQVVDAGMFEGDGHVVFFGGPKSP